MNMWLDEYQMKIVQAVKIVFIALIFVFLSITVYRSAAIIKGFDDSSLCGVLFTLIFLINTYKLDRAIHLNNGKISTYQAKIMLVQFSRSVLLPLVVFYFNKNIVDAIVLAIFFLLGVVAEILVVYLEKKRLQRMCSSQKPQIGEEHEAE